MGVLLLFDARKWTALASTPLWLSVLGPTWKEPRLAKEALALLGTLHPCRMFIAHDGFPAVPLFVPAEAEKDEIVRRVFEQLKEVGELIASLATSVAAGQTVPWPLQELGVDVEPV